MKRWQLFIILLLSLVLSACNQEVIETIPTATSQPKPTIENTTEPTATNTPEKMGVEP